MAYVFRIVWNFFFVGIDEAFDHGRAAVFGRDTIDFWNEFIGIGTATFNQGLCCDVDLVGVGSSGEARVEVFVRGLEGIVSSEPMFVPEGADGSTVLVPLFAFRDEKLLTDL